MGGNKVTFFAGKGGKCKLYYCWPTVTARVGNSFLHKVASIILLFLNPRSFNFPEFVTDFLPYRKLRLQLCASLSGREAVELKGKGAPACL